MNSVIHHHNCPICSSEKIQQFLQLKDYSISQEKFNLMKCSNCTSVFTNPIPSKETIGKYYQSENYISHSNTSKGLIASLYHAVRKITLNQKTKLVKKASKLKVGRLLDIGAGTGFFAKAMTNVGWEVTGLEPDETARSIAQKIHSTHLQSVDDFFKLQSSSYDVITLWHVLEHVHDLHDYFKQFNHLLKNDGILIIAVPNYQSLDAKYYQNYWAAYDVPRHLYHFSPTSIKQLATTYQFELIEIKPMWFDAFYVSLLSEQYKNGKSNLIKGIWHGLVSNIYALMHKNTCSSQIYICKKISSI